MFRCNLFRSMTEEEWRQQHRGHGEPVKSYPENQPPTYYLAHLTCPCGAVLVKMEKGKRKEAQDEPTGA
jgi:hypothetical protein